MLEWLSWESKRLAALCVTISFLLYFIPKPGEAFLLFAALAGSFLSGHLMETALPGALSIPSLSEVISWISLPLTAPCIIIELSAIWVLLPHFLLFRAFFFPFCLHMLAQFSPPAPTNPSLPAAPPIWKQSSPSYISIKNYPQSVHTSDLYCIMFSPTGSCTFAFYHIHPGPDGVTLQSPIFLEKGRILLNLLIWYSWLFSWKFGFLLSRRKSIAQDSRSL